METTVMHQIRLNGATITLPDNVRVKSIDEELNVVLEVDKPASTAWQQLQNCSPSYSQSQLRNIYDVPCSCPIPTPSLAGPCCRCGRNI